MADSSYAFEWSDMAFASKKPLQELNATFIVAPREVSIARFTTLVKAYLRKGNIILGISQESYVQGLEGQPQFRMLQAKTVRGVIAKVNAQGGFPHKIYTLAYFQRELPHLFEKLRFREVVLVNGSWYQSFHTLPAYYALIKNGAPYSMVSPFLDEAEARSYQAAVSPELEALLSAPIAKTVSETAMMQAALDVAKFSFDYTFQTGAVLGKKTSRGYTFLARAANDVVPYQTYAWHHGSSREQHFSPPGDLNYYDAIHAEMNLLVEAQRQNINVAKTTLFMSLLPCPTCARVLSRAAIGEVVYRLDHSDGYAVSLLTATGKLVRRLLI